MLRTMPEHERGPAWQVGKPYLSTGEIELDAGRPEKGIALEGEEAKAKIAPQDFARIAPESSQAILKA